MVAQSLASGAAGAALLSIEEALHDEAGWPVAQAAIRLATHEPLDLGPHAGLFRGVPAIGLLLHAAQADGQPRYERAVAHLDRHIESLTLRRVSAATQSADQGQVAFQDFDIFTGLTGLGAYLLRYQPGSDVLGRALTYLTHLAEPRRDPDGTWTPGWWVSHDPDTTVKTPGGHANLGMAHGAAGILALLALATAHGVQVDGQRDALIQILTEYDRWLQDDPAGPWWPQWITRADLRAGRSSQRAAGRASWCYGVPGVARAHQLAAIATADPARQQAAEAVLAAHLTDERLAGLAGPGLCHGPAGTYQTVWRAAADAPALAARLPALARHLARHHACDPGPPTATGGLLTGHAGDRLAATTARHGTTRSGWDLCLLIN